MSTSILNKPGELQERRKYRDRRTNGERRKSVETKKIEQVSNPGRYGLFFTIISTVLVVLIGITVYKVTGLYDGVGSILGKITLGAVISFCYVAVFRYAIYAR